MGATANASFDSAAFCEAQGRQCFDVLLIRWRRLGLSRCEEHKPLLHDAPRRPPYFMCLRWCLPGTQVNDQFSYLAMSKWYEIRFKSLEYERTNPLRLIMSDLLHQ